jgi:hypothetical protein
MHGHPDRGKRGGESFACHLPRVTHCALFIVSIFCLGFVGSVAKSQQCTSTTSSSRCRQQHGEPIQSRDVESVQDEWFGTSKLLLWHRGPSVQVQYHHQPGILRREDLGEGGLGDCNPSHTPMQARLYLSKDGATPRVDDNNYWILIGSLRSLVNTRPDLAYSVGYASRFMEQAKHVNFVKRILRYVAGTKH